MEGFKDNTLKKFSEGYMEDGVLCEHRYFTSEKKDIVLFRYKSGRQVLFIKEHRVGVWMEMKGSVGHSESSGGKTVKFKYTGVDITTNSEFIMYIVGDKGIYIENTFSFDNVEELAFSKLNIDEEYIALPNKLGLVSMYSAGNELVVVAYEEYITDYVTHLWIGRVGDMRKQVITDERRYRDGGTTYLTTEEGEVYWPSHWEDKGKVPSFTKKDGEVIVMKVIDSSREIGSHYITAALEEVNVNVTNKFKYSDDNDLSDTLKR